MKRSAFATLAALILVAPILLLGMTTGDVEQGKAVFMKRCKMCHGADGEGNPAIARMMKVEFHPMASDYVQQKTDAQLKDIILKGKGKMPAVKGITDEEISDVIAYIHSLGKKE
jgi:mono/diheme cytochrome c family protein